MAGVDLRTVQELMGHKTIAMTLCYSHLEFYKTHPLDKKKRDEQRRGEEGKE